VEPNPAVVRATFESPIQGSAGAAGTPQGMPLSGPRPAGGPSLHVRPSWPSARRGAVLSPHSGHAPAASSQPHRLNPEGPDSFTPVVSSGGSLGASRVSSKFLSQDCPICLEPISAGVGISPCGDQRYQLHFVCIQTIYNTNLSNSENLKCPLCRTPFQSSVVRFLAGVAR
jgi:hypothetical protein